MSRYEKPGFAGAFPTGEMLDAGSLSNAQGSAGAVPDTGGSELGSVPVTDPWLGPSTFLAHMPVGYGSTAGQANDPNTESVSHQSQTSAAWMADPSSHVITPDHPNAG